MMKLAVDVHYVGFFATVAGISFVDWTDSQPLCAYTCSLADVLEYQSGQFFKRELPCILKLLSLHQLQPEIIVIDGYVFLDGDSQPGLGKHLYDSLGGEAAVIGVAKNPYRGIDQKTKLFRGASKKPLYVTTIGIELTKALQYVLSMHGNTRIPTLLKRVDQLSRTRA